MQEERLSVTSLEGIHVILKELRTKWKQGIGINRTQEYTSLVKLCFVSDTSLNLAASRSILYLLKWEMIDAQTLLGSLASVSGEAKNVSAVVNFLARVILDSNKNELHNYIRFISHIISVNKPAVHYVLSVFDELEVKEVVGKFKPVINDLLFNPNSDRLLSWLKITNRVDVHLHHTFLHWLKYTNPEDCSFALISLNKISLGNIQKCFILSSVIHHQMFLACNPVEALALLKSLFPHVGVQTHSIIILTILHGMEGYSKMHLSVIIDFCNWFLENFTAWNEILWFMLVTLIPLTEKNVFSPTCHLKVNTLIDRINENIIHNKTIEMINIKSIVLRYTVHRHNCIHESVLLLRLMKSFSKDEKLLNFWLKKILDYEPTRSIKVLIMMYFISGDVDTRKNCLSVMSKWGFGNVNIFLYQLKKENNPVLQYDILIILAAMGKEKSGCVIFKKLQKSIEGEKHENSYTMCAELYHHAWIRDVTYDASLVDILLKPESEHITEIVQAAAMKNIALRGNCFEELIPLANRIINNSRNNNGTLATAFAIDTISILCERGYLDVTILWEQFMRLVGGDKHPAVQKSVCDFLSKIPLIVTKSDDTNNIIYRSARILWHFMTNLSFDQDSAARSLKEYDLEDFDSSFLSEKCKKHVKSNDVTFIPSSCWLHLFIENDVVDTFVHLINKKSKKAKFTGNYCTLFNGITESLRNLLQNISLNKADSETTYVIICLKILGAKWKNLPPGKDISFVEALLYHSNPEIKKLSLYATLNLYPINDTAKNMFENFLQKKQYSAKENSIFCLLPSQFLAKHREENIEILFDGAYAGLCNQDSIGESLHLNILEVFRTCAEDTSCSRICSRIIMIIMVKLWLKVPFNNLIFPSINKFLAEVYGNPLVKSMPLDSSSHEICTKFVYLSTEVTLSIKSLYGFDVAVKMGLNDHRTRGLILQCLIKVLNGIGTEKRERNIKWLVRLLCTISMHPDDFLCQILVHCASFLSDSNVFFVQESLMTSIDLFPLAIVKISKLRKIAKNVILTLNEIIKQRQVHSTFIEVFKLSIMALRDDPNISFDSVVKKVMES
ncbi:unnamed protein product [Nezara viridula]|uniref:DUF3730 domain-containing protein n=1 Tax=Nezara viridula TaxID=85310 RepID=A0A9P0E6R5_NEZVI|nr:unnamed protein product [Nezara viridula]